jgi:hypothetical protein
MKKALIFLVLIFCGGCKKSLTYKNKSYDSQNMSRSTGEVGLPSGLWDLIAPKGSENSTEFIDVKVYLSERTEGILGGHNFELSYGQGGGTLDLSDFVHEKNGSFFVAIEPVIEAKEAPSKETPTVEKGPEKPAKEAEGEAKKEPKKADEPSAPKIYFLSGAKHRKIGEQFLGSGCNSYYDISSYFSKSMAGEGFLVNTSQERHISALVGTYFFVIHKGSHLLLTQLTIKDSHFKNLQCERLLHESERRTF